MSTIRRMRLASYLAALLVVAMCFSPAASFAKKAPEPAPPLKSIVVFPFVDAASSPVEALGEELSKSIQANLTASGAYRAFAFSERLPSVQRAIMETTLKKDDLKGPFGTEKEQIESALKVAREVAADVMLVGSIESVKVDVAEKKAEISLMAELVDVRTGESTKTVAVAGETPPNAQSALQSDLVAQAAGDAVTKMTKQIAPEMPAQPVEQEQPRKRSSSMRKLLFSLLLGVAVGLIAGNGDSGSSSSTPENPPPVPF